MNDIFSDSYETIASISWGSARRLGTDSAFAADKSYRVRVAADHKSRLAAARRCAVAALPLLEAEEEARLSWSFAPISLDAAALSAALADWSDAQLPVLDLVAILPDLGASPCIVTEGLAWFTGQEISCAVPDGPDRQARGRHVALLAQDMLLNGPIAASGEMAAPDHPSGRARLIVREGWVDLEF